MAENLKTIPEIDFALLFGSVQPGIIEKNSDIDIGVYLNSPVTPDLILSIAKTVENTIIAECDLTILNSVSQILRFEALKGEVLFILDNKTEEYTSLYLLTCREYEDTIAWMRQQKVFKGVCLMQINGVIEQWLDDFRAFIDEVRTAC